MQKQSTPIEHSHYDRSSIDIAEMGQVGFFKSILMFCAVFCKNEFSILGLALPNIALAN